MELEVKDKMAQPQVLEGTWEELKLHEMELSGKRFRLVPLPPEESGDAPQASPPQRHTVQDQCAVTPRKLSGMGKYAGILPSSEEFMRQKQEEIELEERKFRG